MADGRLSEGPPPLVVIVEDDDDVRRLLEFNLSGAGFEVISLSAGEDAVDVALREEAVLMIVDRMLPGMEGLDVCRDARSHPRLDVIGLLILSARGTEDDRVAGLLAGADDYVVKPFSVREVVARAHVLTALVGNRLRARHVTTFAGKVYRWRGLAIDVRRHRVFADGREIELRPLEFHLLIALFERPGQVWTRDQLLEHLWGEEVTPSRRNIDVHVRRLRERLDSFGDIVETIRGTGYRLRPE